MDSWRQGRPVWTTLQRSRPQMMMPGAREEVVKVDKKEQIREMLRGQNRIEILRKIWA